MGPDDAARFHDLMRQRGLWPDMCLAEWHRFLYWSSIDNPYRGALPIGDLLLDRNDALIGAMFYSYFPARIGRWRGIAPSTINVCLRPGSSGLLGIGLVRHYLRRTEFPYVLGCHSNAFAAAVFRKIGVTPCEHTAESFFGILSLQKEVTQRLLAGPRPLAILSRVGLDSALAFAARFAGHNEIPTSPMPENAVLLTEVGSFAREDVDALCREALVGVDVTVDRDWDYLNWRYAKCPRSDRFSFVALQGTQRSLEGLAVLQRNEDGRRIAICETLAPPHKASQLASASIGYARQLGGATVTVLPATPGWAPTWAALGLTKIRKPYPQFWVAHPPGTELPASFVAHYSFGEHKLHWGTPSTKSDHGDDDT